MEQVLRLGAPAHRHRFSFQGRHFWVDAPSGAVHQLDPAALAVLTAAERLAAPPDYAVPVAAVRDALAGQLSAEEVDEIAADLLALAEQGQLFSWPLEQAGGRAPDKSEGSPAPLQLRTLSLHVAHACNLRCRYCFADQGHYRGPVQLMDAGVALRAVDFLFQHAESGAPLTVEFFGGEPLLNLPVIEQVARAIRERERPDQPVAMVVNTNGLPLDEEALRLLDRYQINLVVSLDGRPETHDRMRSAPDGRGSYTAVLGGLKGRQAASSAGKTYLRGVFTSENRRFLPDVEHLLDLESDGVVVEPAVGSGHPWSLGEADAAAVEAEYERLALSLAQRHREGKSTRFLPLSLPPGPPSPWGTGRGCGAGAFELAVDPTGALFPCHRWVGRFEFRVGSVDQGVEHPEVLREFVNARAAGKPACQSCWARSWCGGGCQANGYEQNGSIYSPYQLECRLRRKRLEMAFWLQAEQIQA